MSGLIAKHISKAFAGVQALADVTVEFNSGQVTALMGENGAGKSTLLKILGGDYMPDAGEVWIDGQKVNFTSPLDARRAGLRIVAQEPEIVPFVSVAENLFLGALPGKGWVNSRSLRDQAQEAIERYGFDRILRVDAIGTDLSPAQRQLMEILRCLIDEPKIICFDEPTSSLSDSETNILFGLIERLRSEGRAVGYVSHRLKEIFEIADVVSVLRDGKLVGTTPIAETTPDGVIAMMVGRDLTNMFDRERGQIGDVVLSLKGVTTDDVKDITFDVHAGEVVALAGLVGAGRTELTLAVAGDVPLTSGTITVNGQPLVSSQPKDAIRRGVGLAPEERKADALVMVRSVRENVSLATLDRLTSGGFVRQSEEKELVNGFINKLRVKTPSSETQVENLSGGNQQKVVLARWLARECRVLILDEPTRGVDVGAKAEIYTIIDELADDGVAILIVSSELPEVLGLADRIIVMQDGAVTGELTAEEATEEKVLALAMASELTDEGTQQ